MNGRENDEEAVRHWWMKLRIPAVLVAAGGGIGYLVGRSVAVPMSSEFWDLAAQPLATTAAGAGAITAGYLALHNGAKTRALDARHHSDTMERTRDSDLRDRYTTAAKQLGDENSAIREAGAYAIAALAEDWLRYGDVLEQPALAHSQARACINLLCSYLRANRRALPGWEEDSETVNGFEREEASVRDSIIGVIRENSGRWMSIQMEWIRLGRIPSNTRIKLDLSGARLRKADLTGSMLGLSNLEKTDLEEANLTAANLTRSNLTGAKLSSARLNLAVLKVMNLTQTDFREADLTQAVLVDANLDRTDFRGAQLDSTNLSESWSTHTTVLDDSTMYSERTVWPLDLTPIGRRINTRVSGRQWNVATLPSQVDDESEATD